MVKTYQKNIPQFPSTTFPNIIRKKIPTTPITMVKTIFDVEENSPSSWAPNSTEASFDGPLMEKKPVPMKNLRKLDSYGYMVPIIWL